MTDLNSRPGGARPQTPEACLSPAPAAPDPLANLRDALRRKTRLKTPEASEYIFVVHGVNTAAKTLEKLRVIGGGPEFVKFGRAVFYQRDALDAWVLGKLGQPMRSTSEDTRQPS